ncbi:hypothetical protein LZ31DRAFT_99206 [Colletotrichum somersetense]|nr:hypothetical protein LZ31DRAFT_99206 [Colletotrichum somersetense]
MYSLQGGWFLARSLPSSTKHTPCVRRRELHRDVAYLGTTPPPSITSHPHSHRRNRRLPSWAFLPEPSSGKFVHCLRESWGGGGFFFLSGGFFPPPKDNIIGPAGFDRVRQGGGGGGFNDLTT